MTKIVKFVPTQSTIAKIERPNRPFCIASTRTKEETASSVGKHYKQHIENYKPKTNSKYDQNVFGLNSKKTK